MQVMVRLVQIAAWARLRELGGRGFPMEISPGVWFVSVAGWKMLEKSVFFVSLKYGMNALSS